MIFKWNLIVGNFLQLKKRNKSDLKCYYATYQYMCVSVSGGNELGYDGVYLVMILLADYFLIWVTRKTDVTH